MTTSPHLPVPRRPSRRLIGALRSIREFREFREFRAIREFRVTRALAGGAILLGVLSAVGAASAGAQTEATTATSSTTPATGDTTQVDECSTAAAASFEPGADPGNKVIRVVQVEGFLDPVNADLVTSTLRDADPSDTTLVVLQVDSEGALDIDVADLVAAVRDARVPVAAWVGPSGSQARGAAALLVQAAPIAGVARGSQLGPLFPLSLDGDTAAERSEAVESLRAGNSVHGRPPTVADALIDGQRVGVGEAERSGATECDTSTVGGLIVNLHGVVVDTPDGPITLSTAKLDEFEGRPTRVANQDVVFSKLSLDKRWVHTFTSPSITLLLFIAGLCLVMFEYYTAGVGLAGVTGAACLVASFAGFAHLPVHWWAMALILVAFVVFAVELQVGTIGPYTATGAVLLVVGCWNLFAGSSRLDPPVWVFAIVIVSTIAFMVGGMTAMIRARFSTPTIGRTSLVGEEGTAIDDVAPEGIVEVRGARWRALTNRATPIRAGEVVRVVAVDGFALEVEPEAGGARDYRERRKPAPAAETDETDETDEAIVELVAGEGRDSTDVGATDPVEAADARQP